MWFLPGFSICPACNRPVDDTDDLVTLTVHEVTGVSVEQGFYHRQHFDELPEKDALATRWAAFVRDRVLSRRDSTRILADSARYLVVYNGADDNLVVYFLADAAEIRFRDFKAWSAFHSCLSEIVSSNWPEGGKRDCDGGYKWVIESPKAARLSWLEDKPKCLLLRETDYGMIEGKFADDNGAVDFGAAIEQLGIEPVSRPVINTTPSA